MDNIYFFIYFLLFVFYILILKKNLMLKEKYPKTDLIEISNIDVYVLYIPKRENYIKNIIDRLFLNPIYVEGINKNELDKEELIRKEYISKDWKESEKFNLSRVACHLGHMKILERFLLTDKKYALIFEDDIKVDKCNMNKYRYKINNILLNIPFDADIVYISFCWEHCDKVKYVNNIFYKSYKPLCRHMYLVSNNGARIILENTKKLKAPGDNTIGALIENKKLVSYNVNPYYFNLIQNRDNLGSNLGNNNMYKICKKNNFFKKIENNNL